MYWYRYQVPGRPHNVSVREDPCNPSRRARAGKQRHEGARLGAERTGLGVALQLLAYEKRRNSHTSPMISTNSSKVLGGEAARATPPALHWERRPATTESRRSLQVSLSLPDLKMVERRNQAYAVMWDKHVDLHERQHDVTATIALRRRQEKSVAETWEERRQPHVDAARQLLSNLTADDRHTTGRREALNALQADCLRREEIARRCRIASREAVLAADRAEQLAHLQAEARLRVQYNKEQLADSLAYKRALQLKRQDTNRAAELAARAKQKADKLEWSRRHAAELQQTIMDRRAHKEAAEKKREQEEREQKLARAEAARAKAQANREQRSQMNRQLSAEFAGRLEKALRLANEQAKQAEDAFHCHAMKYDLLDRGTDIGDDRTSNASFGVASSQPDRDVELEFSGTSFISRSVFYDDFAEAEYDRLHTRMEISRRRAERARQSFEQARLDSMSPEEIARERARTQRAQSQSRT